MVWKKISLKWVGYLKEGKNRGKSIGLIFLRY